jgi:response regulator RpfG family c-di-GMP phosphodiesterase
LVDLRVQLIFKHQRHPRERIIGRGNIMVTTEKRLTIMILDDEEDILALYSDYLSNKGHRVLKTYVNADTILYDIDIEPADVYIIDYRLPVNKNWI